MKLNWKYQPLAPGNDYLPDGRRVYWQRNEFDCFRACLATVLQVPYEDVPAEPPDADDSTAREVAGARILEWLETRDLQLTRRPINPKLGGYSGWIGISVDPDPAFTHACVFDRLTLIFDPALGFPAPPGHHVAETREFHAAYTLDPLGETQ